VPVAAPVAVQQAPDESPGFTSLFSKSTVLYGTRAVCVPQGQGLGKDSVPSLGFWVLGLHAPVGIEFDES
jgi:hypothetical protein